MWNVDELKRSPWPAAVAGALVFSFFTATGVDLWLTERCLQRSSAEATATVTSKRLTGKNRSEASIEYTFKNATTGEQVAGHQSLRAYNSRGLEPGTRIPVWYCTAEPNRSALDLERLTRERSSMGLGAILALLMFGTMTAFCWMKSLVKDERPPDYDDVALTSTANRFPIRRRS
jgi:Protein of unknown function (DUF3592)